MLGKLGRLETWETSRVHVQTELVKYWLIPRFSASAFGESPKCKPVKLNITLFIITKQRGKKRQKKERGDKKQELNEGLASNNLDTVSLKLKRASTNQ